MNGERMEQQDSTWRPKALVALIITLTVLMSGCQNSSHSSSSYPPPTYTVGGTVAGLATGDSVVLTDNGGDAVTVKANGHFTFSIALAGGAGYSVGVGAQPGGQTCSVAGGTGRISSANVANVVVTCSDQAYSLGGTIQGLTTAGLVLANGSDTVTVNPGDTTFTFPTQVAYTSSYTVTVKTQPDGQSCAVSKGTGTMPAAAVTDVAVSCTDQPFTIGGTISGLGSNSGLVLDNGADSLTVAAGSTTFTLPTAVPFGSPYAVTVHSSPPGLVCTVSNGSGTVPAGNVTTISVTCSDQSYPLGGSIAGLTTSGLLLADGTDTVSVPAGATSFTFPTQVAFGSSYAVTVKTPPTGLTCSVSAGTSTMPAAPVTSVAVTCSPITYTVGGTISGLTATGLVLASGSDAVTVLANATTFSLQEGIAYGSPYDVVVQTQPSGLNCTVTDGTGPVTGNVSTVSVSCTPASITLTIPGAPAPVVIFVGACVSQSTASYTYTCLTSSAVISAMFDTEPGTASFELTGSSTAPSAVLGGSCSAGFNPTAGTFTISTPSFTNTDTIPLSGAHLAQVTYSASYLESLGVPAGLAATALIIVDPSNSYHFQVLETSSITAGAVTVSELYAEGGTYSFGTGGASLSTFACQAQ